jgi:hypothetical protein
VSSQSQNSISFRLDEESAKVLSMRANKLGVSRHELARHYVCEILQEAEERAVLRLAMDSIRIGLEETREDLALAVEAILTSAGKVDPREARAWISKHLKSA